MVGTANGFVVARAVSVRVHLDGDFTASADGAGRCGLGRAAVAGNRGGGDIGDGRVVGGHVDAGGFHVLRTNPELLPGGVGGSRAGESEESD